MGLAGGNEEIHRVGGERLSAVKWESGLNAKVWRVAKSAEEDILNGLICWITKSWQL
jgi:hypothetical protein